MRRKRPAMFCGFCVEKRRQAPPHEGRASGGAQALPPSLGHQARAGEGMTMHAWQVELDHQRGGWMARCSCGWEARRPCWYQARAKRFAKAHAEDRGRWAALPMGEKP